MVHASELPFVFGNPSYPCVFGPEEIALSGFMRETWTTFAKALSPRTPAMSGWPVYTEEHQQGVVLQTLSQGWVKVEEGYREDQCRFWFTTPLYSNP